MPKKAPYSQTPAVPVKKLAGTNPAGKVLVGSGMPGVVPKHVGSTSRGITPKNEFKQLKPHGFSQKLKRKKAKHGM